MSSGEYWGQSVINISGIAVSSLLLSGFPPKAHSRQIKSFSVSVTIGKNILSKSLSYFNGFITFT